MARDPLIVGRIPPALEARVNEHVAATGMTKSELIREALVEYLEDGGMQTPATPLRDARGARTRSHPANPKAGICEHRVRSGAYCRHCDRVVP